MAKARKKRSVRDTRDTGIAMVREGTLECVIIVRELDKHGMPLPQVFWGDRDMIKQSKRLFEETIEMYRKNPDAWG